MKPRLLILIGILILSAAIAAIVIPPRLNAPEYGTVSFGRGKTIIVEIARTDAVRRRGLSGRQSIGDDEGMLFLFEDEKVRSFWMHEMNFSIDIIWLNGDVVVGIEDSAPPPGDPNAVPGTYYSPVAVDRVLEVQGGFSLRHGVNIGQEISVDLDLDGEPD